MNKAKREREIKNNQVLLLFLKRVIFFPSFFPFHLVSLFPIEGVKVTATEIEGISRFSVGELFFLNFSAGRFFFRESAFRHNFFWIFFFLSARDAALDLIFGDLAHLEGLDESAVLGLVFAGRQRGDAGWGRWRTCWEKKDIWDFLYMCTIYITENTRNVSLIRVFLPPN